MAKIDDVVMSGSADEEKEVSRRRAEANAQHLFTSGGRTSNTLPPRCNSTVTTLTHSHTTPQHQPWQEKYVCAEYEEAVELEDSKPAKAEKMFKALLVQGGAEGAATAPHAEEFQKVCEQCVYRLATIYALTSQTQKVRSLLDECAPFFARLAKSKTAKIVRSTIDKVLAVGDEQKVDTTDESMALCESTIDWCVAQKRSFLRQRIQARLAALHLRKKAYKVALEMVTTLMREVKKLDDKLLIVEICLTESAVHQVRSITATLASANHLLAFVFVIKHSLFIQSRSLLVNSFLYEALANHAEEQSGADDGAYCTQRHTTAHTHTHTRSHTSYTLHCTHHFTL
jgi:hypothetical protein